ncbi:hypothetical protein EVAR_25700_1 [Eumeta japonica]|uniref:Uncharacterized protein n=1 Tax=Eumeta variegata TaxID=151549 RepID=A0A4C1WH84_EUMVA|nr:hypothetical protein EVAR_25700_1 [Eumeta japonica]
MRSGALIIRPTEKEMYAKILERIMKVIPIDQVRTTVDKICKAVAEVMLMTLSKKSTDIVKQVDKQKNMKILQFKLNHCGAAYDLFMQTMRELKLDLVLITEPYRYLSNQLWEPDSTIKAVI